MMVRHVKRWPTSVGDHLVCSRARRARPPCPFDLGLAGTGLRRLCHSRLAHRTVLALTLWLLRKCRAQYAGCSLDVYGRYSSQVTSAFATDGWLGALQVFPQATSRGPQLSTLQAFPSITTVSFTCPPGRSHAVTRVEGFVARACLGFVSFSQVEPVIRLNRPISGAGFAPASHRVLLAAPAGRWNDWPADSWMLHPLPSKPLRQVMRATTTSLICLRRAASVGSTITVGYFRDCYAKGRFRRDR